VQKNVSTTPPPPPTEAQSLTVLANVTNWQKMGRIKHASGWINLLPDLLGQRGDGLNPFMRAFRKYKIKADFTFDKVLKDKRQQK
jgi:hypothetical protein